MSIESPLPGDPRRPHGPLDPGDAFVVAPDGERFWGRYGAAGLLAHDPSRGVLMQHRVGWSHHGGTWALPGGALHRGESAREGALREAHEEAGVPQDAVRPLFLSVADRGVWSYSTLVARVTRPFEPVISDAESLALAWVPVDRVRDLPLHPGFAASWPGLSALLDLAPALVVDVRAGGAGARRAAGQLAGEGMEGALFGVPVDRVFPEVVEVDVEGASQGTAQALRDRGRPTVLASGLPGVGCAGPHGNSREGRGSGEHPPGVS